MSDSPIFSRKFTDVLRTELNAVKDRRRTALLTQTPSPKSGEEAKLDGTAESSVENGKSDNTGLENRAGLALSGGGVRSASFNLGAMQALYRRGVLRQFDYLSTVSGGGYIGGFFASLVCDPNSKIDLTTEDPTYKRGDGGPLGRRRPPTQKDGTQADGNNDGGSSPHESNGHAAHHDNGKVRRDEKLSASENQRRPDFLPSKTGKQPSAVRRLIHGGMYLRRPMLFLNRYLFGIVVLNAMILSALAAVMAFAAWLFRIWDDTEYTREYTGLSLRWIPEAIGFKGDVRLAFFWTVLLALLWAVAWLLRTWAERWANDRAWVPTDRVFVRRMSFVTKVLCWGTLLSVPMAILTLLATGQVAAANPNAAPDEGVVSWITGSLSTILLVGQALALLPVLKFKSLLNSGTNPQNIAERITFRIASAALVFGIPLSLFWFFVQEDLSGVVKYRDEIRPGVGLIDYKAPQLLSYGDTKDWPGFWQMMMRRAGDVSADESTDPGSHEDDVRRPARELVEAAARISIIDPKSGEKSGIEALEWVVRNSLRIREWQDNSYLPMRLRSVVDVYRALNKDHEYKIAVIDAVNRYALSDPGFHQAFAGFDGDDADRRPEGILPQGAVVARIIDLRLRGETLEQEFEEFRQELLNDSKFRAEMDRNDSLYSSEGLIRYASVFQTADVIPNSWIYNNNLDADGQEVKKIRLWRLLREIQLNNRRLLQAYAPDSIRPEQTVYALVVHARDQKTRLVYAGGFAVLFVVLAIGMNLNATSVHASYRESLAAMWIVGRAPKGGEVQLADLETATDRGGPYLLVNATATMPPRLDPRPHGWLRKAERSNDKTCGLAEQTGYLLSSKYCGSDRTGYVLTNANTAYQYRHLALADAVTISGAAVAPEASNDFLLRALMTISNLRLGQRLINPRRYDDRNQLQGQRWRRRHIPLPRNRFFPNLWTIALDRFDEPEDRTFVSLSDGGHYENLGIEALLRRRTRVIVAIDAGQDGDLEFSDLFKLVRRCRAMYGIRIYTQEDDRQYLKAGESLSRKTPHKCFLDDDIRCLQAFLSGEDDDSGLCSDSSSSSEMKGAKVPRGDAMADSVTKAENRAEKKRKRAQRHFLVARIEYPPVEEMYGGNSRLDEVGPTESQGDGYLIYVKPSFTGDEDADLAGYGRSNAAFPHDPTMDQFYEPRRFESYRQLGEHIGERIADVLYAPYLDNLPEKELLWLANWPPESVERVGTDGQGPPSAASLGGSKPGPKPEPPESGPTYANESSASYSNEPMYDALIVKAEAGEGGVAVAGTKTSLLDQLRDGFNGDRIRARKAFAGIVKSLSPGHRVHVRKLLHEEFGKRRNKEYRLRCILAFRCFPSEDDQEVRQCLDALNKKYKLKGEEKRIWARVRYRIWKRKKPNTK